MDKIRVIFLIILIGLLVTSLLIFSCSKRTQKDLNIVQVNSLRGKVFAEEDEGVKYGGFSLISNKISEIKESIEEERLTLIANSNFLYGSPEAYFTEGKAIIDMLNKLNFDMLIVGHRELYFGRNVLESLSKTASFPFLSANLVEADGSIPTFIKPYTIIEESNLAVIGISTHMLIETNISEDLQGLRLIPIREALDKYIKELKAMNIKNIVLAGDLLYSNDTEYERNKQLLEALEVQGIDLYFVRSKKVKGNEKIITRKNKKIFINGSNGKYLGYYRKSNNEEEYSIYEINSNLVEPDPKLTETLVQLHKTIDTIAGNKLGEAKTDINHSFHEESALGNLVTDIMREKLKTDIFLYNSGSLRNGFKKGNISKKQMYSILPWGGSAIILKLTGKQIIKVLEASCSFRLEKSFLQVSGIQFKYDSSKEKGNRIIESSVKINGKKIDLDKKYLVGTGRYIFDGGDKYFEFQEMNIKIHKISPKSIRQMVSKYISTNKIVESIVEGRIVDVNK